MEQQDLLKSNYGGQQNLPNATASLVLGIISIVATFCYGIGIICGIIGLVLANKDKKLYLANPEMYTPSSYGTLNAGRVCSIIGVVLSALVIVAIILLIIFFGTIAATQGRWN
ncbi:MAG: DUF4190 domain-containing protein [Chitinophagaceae bacterium]|nr:DUF4190 domain-containing protein [Chitinophagaceae bacterium]